VVEDFARMNAGRILVNTPTSQGAIGGTFNTLRPSLTLACGTDAGNVSTDNISTDHLLNIHRGPAPAQLALARQGPRPAWTSASARTFGRSTEELVGQGGLVVGGMQ
jgi:hypothetical protein